MSESALQREAQRQQWLLRTLASSTPPVDLQTWLRGSPTQHQHGLRAYQGNAAASAERALAAAYPTVQQLCGHAAFAALARAHWQAQPPRCGDLAAWGAALPGFIDQAGQVATEPYLGDMARLDWALHQAGLAHDDDAPATGLDQLASVDPAALHLRLRAGHAVLLSAHPVHTLWAAHQHTAAGRFDAARQALAEHRAEAVRVRRDGLPAVAECISHSTATFEQDLLHGLPLATALARADPAFSFEAWFIDTLRRDGLAAVLLRPPSSPAGT